MPRPRLIPRLLLCLALGLLTTLAVAIASAALFTVSSPRPTLHRAFIMDGRPWSVYEHSRFGAVCSGWTRLTREYFTAPPPPSADGTPAPPTVFPPEPPEQLIAALHAVNQANLHLASGPPIPDTDSPPLWGTFAPARTLPADMPAQNGETVRPSGLDIGYGWPFVALWFQQRGRSIDNAIHTDETRGVYVLSGAPHIRGPMSCRVIPYLPSWLGLLANTALFSLLWFLLLFATGITRRALRRRAGRCATCNYDLRATAANLPCPECGCAPAPPRPTQSA